MNGNLELGVRYAAQGVYGFNGNLAEVEILDRTPAAYSHKGNPKLRARVVLPDGATEERVIPAHDILKTWPEYQAERARQAAEDEARREARRATLAAREGLPPQLWELTMTESQSRMSSLVVEARTEEEARELAEETLHEQLHDTYLEWDDPVTVVEPHDGSRGVPPRVEASYRDEEAGGS